MRPLPSGISAVVGVLLAAGVIWGPATKAELVPAVPVDGQMS